MKEIELVTPIISLQYGELEPERRKLVDEARRAVKGAYAPYSHFQVGAAILLQNGVVVTGANQENVAYPSGTCAERSACYYAGANYPDIPFECIAVTAIGTDGKRTPTQRPVVPAGRRCWNMKCAPAIMYPLFSTAKMKFTFCPR